MFKRYLMDTSFLRAPDGGGGGGDDEAAIAAQAAADKAAADKIAADAAEAARIAALPKPTDAEAKLLRELMGHKRKAEEVAAEKTALETKLKAFEGIDPEAVRSLLADKTAADAAKAKAEEDRQLAAGEFAAVRTRMAGEHVKAIELKDEAIAAERARISGLEKTIRELTIGTSFASSVYLRDETLLPPRQARLSYERHFEVVDGIVQAFDKPAGSSDRIPLVDARGQPLPFDEAMKAIIDADPDRDALLRAKGTPGSGVVPGGVKVPVTGGGGEELTGLDRIAAGLRARRGK